MCDQDPQWRTWLEATRRRRAGAATIADGAEVAALCAALLKLGERLARTPGTVAHTLVQQRGETAWEVALDRRIFGDETSARPLKSLPHAMTEADDRDELTCPRAFAIKALHNLALDELRKQRWMTPTDASHAAEEGGSFLDRDPDAAGGRTTEVDPTALPAEVAATLRHCERLAPVYEAVCGEAVNTAPWRDTADVLERDVALGAERLRWPGDHAVTLDRHARAWQATYYGHEGPPSYTDDAETPYAGAPDRAKFDKHTSRFRELWRTASGDAAAVVAAAAGREVPGRGRVPASWDPPDHATLRGRGQAGGGR